MGTIVDTGNVLHGSFTHALISQRGHSFRLLSLKVHAWWWRHRRPRPPPPLPLPLPLLPPRALPFARDRPPLRPAPSSSLSSAAASASASAAAAFRASAMRLRRLSRAAAASVAMKAATLAVSRGAASSDARLLVTTSTCRCVASTAPRARARQAGTLVRLANARSCINDGNASSGNATLWWYAPRWSRSSDSASRSMMSCTVLACSCAWASFRLTCRRGGAAVRPPARTGLCR
mmetsp:Transcript_22711/g.79411  ORF Transcript_22711/g.79411 Transcript_22711/m.79411 type:complete len:234 (+) Transcript_22711:52-753(+)